MGAAAPGGRDGSRARHSQQYSVGDQKNPGLTTGTGCTHDRDANAGCAGRGGIGAKASSLPATNAAVPKYFALSALDGRDVTGSIFDSMEEPGSVVIDSVLPVPQMSFMTALTQVFGAIRSEILTISEARAVTEYFRELVDGWIYNCYQHDPQFILPLTPGQLHVRQTISFVLTNGCNPELHYARHAFAGLLLRPE